MQIKNLETKIEVSQNDRDHAIEINENIRQILNHSTEESVLIFNGNRWSMNDLRELQVKLSALSTATEMTLEAPDVSQYEDADPEVEYLVGD